jgi:WD40 repeat protein
MSVHRSLLLREKSNLNHNFREKFLGSLYFAERYESPTVLEGHTGCVNSILFSECGSRIITGSDDMNINIYDLNGEIIDHMNTMHTNNVFFAKDLPVSSCNDIVSCAADGRVVLTNVVKSKVSKYICV